MLPFKAALFPSGFHPRQGIWFPAAGKRPFTCLAESSESGANGAADFVGIRRQDGNGAVLLVMDKNSIQYWVMKISTRSAIENSPMGRGIVYLAAERCRGAAPDSDRQRSR